MESEDESSDLEIEEGLEKGIQTQIQPPSFINTFPLQSSEESSIITFGSKESNKESSSSSSSESSSSSSGSESSDSEDNSK